MPPNLISLYIVAAMVGIMVFFTIAVAPTVFKVLPPEWSSKYVRRFFPKCYAFLCFACISASLLASDALISTLTFLCAILFAIAQFILTPAINKASDNKDKKRFGLLHGLSVVINVLQLGIFIYILWPSVS